MRLTGARTPAKVIRIGRWRANSRYPRRRHSVQPEYWAATIPGKVSRKPKGANQVAKILAGVFLGLSGLVFLISILTHIGDSTYIEKCLLLPATIVFAASLLALAIADSGSKRGDA